MNNYDVLVVGAGMAGIYSVYKMREQGWSVHALEAGSGVGGTWFWNRYPGARCDVESLDYSYSFSDELQKESRWSEVFAAQPEILEYLNRVVDRFDLREDFTFDAAVVSAHYNEAADRWTVKTAKDTYSARYVIMATGLLSVPLAPAIPGIEAFKGEVYLTGAWPDRPVDFAGKRVGVFGNGSSGMQVVPTVARQAGHLTLFQRTAAYAIPMRNASMNEADWDEIHRGYADRRAGTRNSVVGTYWSAFENGDKSVFDVSEEEMLREFEDRWRRGGPGFVVAYTDLLLDLKANKLASDFVRQQIRHIVKDPAIAAKLLPRDDLPIGCKRLAVELGYFEAFNRPNVSLVDLKSEPIVEIVPNGIRTSDSLHEFDMLIMATGFDAFSGAMAKMDIVGRGGVTLKDEWRDGPHNYLGMLMNGFPNMFTVNGPATVAANFFLATEMQVDWLARLLDTAREQSIVAIETDRAGEQEWMAHLQEVADYVTATNYCETWFRGTNVAGKPAVVMNYLGGLGAYAQYCNGVASDNYRHLTLRAAEPA